MIRLLQIIVLLAVVVAAYVFFAVAPPQSQTSAKIGILRAAILNDVRLHGTFDLQRLDRRDLIDAWGNPFSIRVDDTPKLLITITSFGADGKPGGRENDADIVGSFNVRTSSGAIESNHGDWVSALHTVADGQGP